VGIVERLRAADENSQQRIMGSRIFGEAADEIERLTAALKKANEQAEHFEREWYSRGDALEDIATAYYSAPEVLREKAALALRVPNK